MPQNIEIPGLGIVEFPDGMSDEEIARAIKKDSLLRQKEELDNAVDFAGPIAKAADIVSDFMVRPVADPIGTIGRGLSAAGNVAAGMALDAMADWQAGRLPAMERPNTAAALEGTQMPGEEGLTAIQQGLLDAVRTSPAIGTAIAAQAVGIPAPVAFGAPFAAQAYAETGDAVQAVQAGTMAAAIPGVGQLGRKLGARLLTKAVDAGWLSAESTVAQKAVEAMASQALVQAGIELTRLPEYVQMEPTQRKDAFVRSLASNLAFSMLELPAFRSGIPSETQRQLGVELESFVNDAITQNAQDLALEQLDPRNAQVRSTGLGAKGEHGRTGQGPEKSATSSEEDVIRQAVDYGKRVIEKRVGDTYDPESSDDLALERGGIPTGEISQSKAVEQFGRQFEPGEHVVVRILGNENAKAIEVAKVVKDESPLKNKADAVEAPIVDTATHNTPSRANMLLLNEGRPAAEEQELLASVERATLPRQLDSATPPPSTDQPISLASIRQYLSSALDIPVRSQGYRERAFGIFKSKPETIRLKALNDIPTLAHEVGHYLHYILFPKGGKLNHTTIAADAFSKRFDNELLSLGQKSSRSSYSTEQIRQEGVAEFFREWLSDRTQALAKAPQFAAYFEGEIGNKYPDVWTIVTRAREDLGRYINQPAEQKIASMINRDRENRQDQISTRLFRSYTKWVNDLAPLERSMNQLERFGLNPTQAKIVSDYAVNYIGGWRGKVEHSLFHKQIDLNGNEVGPSLKDILGGIHDIEDFSTYLVAKRALEKNRQGKETGIESADARVVVSNLEPTYGQKARQLREFQRHNLRLLLDSGILSPDQFRRMEALNEDYVPFYRVYERIAGQGERKGQGLINLSQGIGRFQGSDRQIVDPLESILKNAYLFRDLAERNRVAQLFVDAVEATRGGGRIAEQVARKVKPVEVPHHEIVRALESAGIGSKDFEGIDLTFKVWRAARSQSAKDGIFTVWKNGKETPYQVDDPLLYRALSLADVNDMRMFSGIPGMQSARWFTRSLRAGATLSPEFLVRNPFRDQITAAVYSRHGFVPFFDGFRGALSALKKDHWYQDWLKAGGRYSDFVAADRRDLQSALGDIIKDPPKLDAALELANPRNILKNLQRFSELMEMGTRIGEFRRAKQSGANDVQAANASKEVTLNFARSGIHGKFMNQLVAFFNAKIQDLDKFAREHKERPLATSTKAFMYIGLPSLLSWWLGKDDREIQRLPEWRKNYFWNINLEPIARAAGVDGFDVVFSYPKPFLLGQIYGSSIERGLDYAYGKDPNAVRKWFRAALESTPLSLDAILPTAVRPLIESKADYSFFRNQPIESSALKQLPNEFRFAPGSSITARVLSPYIPWDWAASPVKLDNTIRGYFGSLGKYGTDATDWILVRSGLVDVPAQPAKAFWERPLIRAFVNSPYEPSAFVERFYKGLEAADQRIVTLQKAGELLDTQQKQKWLKENSPDLGFYLAEVDGRRRINELHRFREQLGGIVKAMHSVQMSRDLGPESKREKLVHLSRLRDEMAEFGFKSYISAADQRKSY